MKRENAAKRYYRKNLIIFIAVFAPLMLLFLIFPLAATMSAGIEYSAYWLFPIIMFVVPTPFIIYYLAQFIHYSNVNFVEVHRGTVYDCDTIDRGRYGHFIGFYVRFEEIDGNRTVLTKHVHTKADGYLGSMVEVGLDAARGEWIVLE